MDDVLRGFHRGETYLMAARSGMGKTALVLNIINRIAIKDKNRVVYFTLELGREQVIDRLIQLTAKAETHKYQSNVDCIMNDVDKISALLDKAEIYIEDMSQITTKEIDSTLYEIGESIDLVVIDYLQLMGDADNIFEVLDNLKSCAYFHDCPILILSNLTKESDFREEHRPGISDLRYPKIERHVDIIMFLYRDDYYEKDSDKKGIAEIIIPRNKHTDYCNFELAWIPEYLTFVSFDKSNYKMD